MKKRMRVVFAAGLCLLLMASVAVAATIEHRIRTQHDRIRSGIASGELTPSESEVLRMNLNYIESRFRRLTADGYMTSSERRSLEQMLDQNSRMIENRKNNRASLIFTSRFEERIRDQQQRIDSGIANRRLTRDEADIVQDNLNWIKSRLAAFRSDGNLNAQEWERLDRMLDENGRLIYKEKHDQRIRRLY